MNSVVKFAILITAISFNVIGCTSSNENDMHFLNYHLDGVHFMSLQKSVYGKMEFDHRKNITRAFFFSTNEKELNFMTLKLFHKSRWHQENSSLDYNEALMEDFENLSGVNVNTAGITMIDSKILYRTYKREEHCNDYIGQLVGDYAVFMSLTKSCSDTFELKEVLNVNFSGLNIYLDSEKIDSYEFEAGLRELVR